MSDTKTALAPVQQQTAVNRAMGRAELVEQVLLTGDLSKLTAEERVGHYLAVCQAVGLNPVTKPFDYLSLNGKLVLYANKGCAEQLRSNKKISFTKPETTIDDKLGIIMVSVTGRDETGRTDTDIGAVPLPKGSEDRCNAVMKAITKAKRRTTLSICGLNMLDDTERETIRGAEVINIDPATGQLIDDAPAGYDGYDDLCAAYMAVGDMSDAEVARQAWRACNRTGNNAKDLLTSEQKAELKSLREQAKAFIDELAEAQADEAAEEDVTDAEFEDDDDGTEGN